MIYRLKRSTLYKMLMTVAALAASAMIAGMGTFATFTTSTTPTSNTMASGTLCISLGNGSTLDVGATGLVPGDSLQRLIDLSNCGDVDLASIVLTTTATTSSALNTDSDGLTAKIERCSQAWTQAAANVYTCGGTTQSVLGERAVIGNNMSLSNLSATTTGASDKLRLTLALPTSAGNALQGLSSTISFTFSGTQRNGTNK